MSANLKLGEDRGKKRAADDTLDDEQRFAKRFNLLNLAGRDGSKLYIPIPSTQSLHATPTATTDNNFTRDNEHMNLDDTKDRVYIHDLDEELADIESDEEKIIFLPDIEKKLSKIPKHVLTGNKAESHEGQELVLYAVPASLSVPEEQDSVRKAIAEARQRAREKAAVEAGSFGRAENPRSYDMPETAHGLGPEDYVEEADPDAMDIG